MTIPRGATVILNAWNVHHDPKRWDRPQDFNPSRYRNMTQLASVYANSRDPQKRDHFGYGIGRRICPGIHLAERTLWLAMARILWAFDIKPKVDAVTGRSIPIDVDPVTGYTDGFVNQCLPFEVDVKIRSDKRRETIFKDDLFHAFD
jgi:cytochrome P450 family 619